MRERERERDRERHAISESVFIDHSQFCQPCLTVGVQLYEDKVIFREWMTLILTWHTHTLPRCTCTHTHTYLIIKQAPLQRAPQLNFSFISALSNVRALKCIYATGFPLHISMQTGPPKGFIFSDHLGQNWANSKLPMQKKSTPFLLPLPVRQHLDLMSSQRKSHVSPQLLQ